MRILVYGAGVLGGNLALNLYKAGKDVSVADLDEDSFDIFKEEAMRSGMLKGKNLDNPRKILEELELIKDGKLTTAAVLLFHKQPSRIISGAKVEIGKMRNEGDVVNKEEIKGSLMTLSRSVLDVLQVKYLTSLISYDGAKRIETSPYPFNALREAVLNLSCIMIGQLVNQYLSRYMTIHL